MFVHATASSAVQSASLPHVDLDTPSPAGENHVEPEDPSDDPAVLEGDLSASRPNLPPTALTPVRCPLSLVQFCFRLELQGTVQALMSPIAAPGGRPVLTRGPPGGDKESARFLYWHPAPEATPREGREIIL